MIVALSPILKVDTRVSTFNIGDRATITEALPQKVHQVVKEKKVAPVAMLNTNKKLAPKVPNNDEWESF